jgi:ubiquinone/menaquinone biosynthesis C-methylase UbiE
VSGIAFDPDTFAEFERSGWEGAAEAYDAFWASLTERVAEPLLDAAGVAAGSRVLDVACGPGNVASIAAQRSAVVTGVDVAAAMVARASAAHPEITFREANAESLPFSDASFDAAIANFLILHLGDPDRGAAELARVLVSGGAVAMTTWDHADRTEIFHLLDAAVERVGAPASGGVPEGPDPFRFADDSELRALLERSGLDEIRVDTVSFEQQLALGDLWRGVSDGTVRMRAYLRAQSGETRARIRDAAGELLAERGGTIRFSVKLGSGRKP